MVSLAASPAKQRFVRESCEMVAEACGDKDMVLAAILFQAVQDGEIALSDVEAEMGANVATLTENSAEVSPPRRGTRRAGGRAGGRARGRAKRDEATPMTSC